MNLKLIDAASAAYNDLPQDDLNRLVFMRSVWGVQAAAVESAACSYEAPSAHDLGIYASKGDFVFKHAPVAVDAALLCETAAQIAECIAVKKMFAADSQVLVEGFDWSSLSDGLDIDIAGSDPAAFVDLVFSGLAEGGLSDQAALTGASIVSQALYCQLVKPAASVVKALKAADLFEDMHPLTCPVCGCAPTMSHVGGKTSSQGRGRLLICPQCATAWEFERIRCARCGQKNPNHLHYFNIEGDDAHRIGTCDDCGGYIRTLFSEEGDLRAVAYEVEDVVMARLDAIAADPRFHTKG